MIGSVAFDFLPFLLIRSVGRPFYSRSSRSRYVRSYGSPFASDDVEFDSLSFADRSDRFLGIILGDDRLVDEQILLRVVSDDESVSGLGVEPPDGSCDSGSDQLFRSLLAGFFRRN